jgi:nitroreductase
MLFGKAGVDADRDEANASLDRKLRDLLVERYGDSIVSDFIATIPGSWPDVIPLMLSHKSVRGYTSEPLPAGTLEILMAAGQSAATSGNMQTVSVVATTDRAAILRLADASQRQAFIETCPLFLSFIADLSRAERVGYRIGVDLFALPLTESFLTAAIDCGIFAQNVVVAAESIGLGTCYIGGLRNKPDVVAEELNLPQGAIALFGLCIGYPDKHKLTDIRPRVPQHVAVHREKYSVADEEAALSHYDEISARHEVRQKRTVPAWRLRHRDRFANRVYLAEREQLKDGILGRGFPLK